MPLDSRTLGLFEAIKWRQVLEEPHNVLERRGGAIPDIVPSGGPCDTERSVELTPDEQCREQARVEVVSAACRQLGLCSEVPATKKKTCDSRVGNSSLN